MNFHRYQGLAAGHLEFQQRAYPDLRPLPRHEVERRLALEPSAQPVLQLEREWRKDAKPYYRVWPAIIQPMLSLKLEKVECRHIHLPVRTLCVEMPVGRSLRVDPTAAAFWQKHQKELVGPFELATIMACQEHDRIRLQINWLGATWLFGRFDLPLNAENVEAAIPDLVRPMFPGDPGTPELERPAVVDAVRLLCMIALIRDDPTLVVPRVLAADQRKWEETHDTALVERSRRRGNVGWDLGKIIEEAAEAVAKSHDPQEPDPTRTVSPHYRHAHPALFWTGKGRETPRIALRRGSFVHGDAIGDVPTGWYGDEAPPCPFCLAPMTRDGARWHCEDCIPTYAAFGYGPNLSSGTRAGRAPETADWRYHGEHQRDR